MENRNSDIYTQILIATQEDPLEKEIATHSSILAWKISWTEGCSPWGRKESGMTERLTLTVYCKNGFQESRIVNILKMRNQQVKKS